MARATKALITRQDLMDMAKEGLILLRPGTGIELSGTNINKVLSREEIAQFAYIDGNPFDLEDGSQFLLRSISTGPETFSPPPGFTNDSVTISKFTPSPAVNGVRNNSGTITNVYSTVPADKNRMTHYGIDARFSDYIVSPAVSLYSKTIHLTNNRADQGLFTATLTVGKSGTTPTGTYSRSSSGSTDLSGNIKLGNLVNFSLTLPSVWPSGGILVMEVFENNILQYTKSVNIGAYGSSSLTLNDYNIRFGINYEFKGKSIMVTEYDGAFSNVTGQRACSLI